MKQLFIKAHTASFHSFISFNTTHSAIHKLVIWLVIPLCLLLASCQQMKPSPTASDEQTQTRQSFDPLYLLIDKDIDAFRLSSPPENNALAKLTTISEINPNDERLSNYKDKVAHRYLYLAQASINRKKWNKVRWYIDQAISINRDLNQIEKLKSSLAKAITEDKEETGDKEKNKLTLTTKATPEESPLAAFQKRDRQPSIDTKTNSLTSTVANLIIKLNQNQISARSNLISLSLDKASQKIIDRNATVTIVTQSFRDYRWLSALLKTSIYFIDSDFEVETDSNVDSSTEPKLIIKPRKKTSQARS